MDRFTASNDIVVEIDDDQLFVRQTALSLPVAVAGDDYIDALREFFRAEDDERLGRWRWPENPDYVVYPKADGSVRAMEGFTGQSGVFTRQSVDSPATFADVARAYFDAHPEPKPWWDAKPGEVWELTFSEAGGGGTEPYMVDRECRFTHPNYINTVKRLDSTITAATRIYPKEL